MLSSVSGVTPTVRTPWIELFFLFFGAFDSHIYAYLHQHLLFDTIFNQVLSVTQNKYNWERVTQIKMYNVVLQTKMMQLNLFYL